MLYKLDELTSGTAFEAEYDQAIAEGLSHADAVARASQVIEDMTPEKVLRYAVVYKNYMAEAEMLDIESKKLDTRSMVKQNKAEALKNRLQALLPPDFELEGPKAVVKFRKCAPSCLIIDPEAIPESFKSVVPETRIIEKALILKALKEKVAVPGAELAPEKFNVQIK